MHVNFEPHSWYMGFAIKDNGELTGDNPGNARGYRWEAFIDNGNTYNIDDVEADTLKALKFNIREYHVKKANNNINHMPVSLIKPLTLHIVRTQIPL